LAGDAKPTGADLASLDKTADPCTDFYQYACGGWMAKNPVPADQSSWDRFGELIENNRKILKDILEKASVPDSKRDETGQKIGDFYAACMDDSAVEKLGAAPLAADLKDIAAISDAKSLTREIIKLHREGIPALLNMASEQDRRDATKVILGLDQGGLGLEDRDYYLKQDADTVKIRRQYAEHAANMFALLGETKEAADADAKTLLDFETELAQASQDKVFRREPANTYHPTTLDGMTANYPGIDWKEFFSAMDLAKKAGINVYAPDFYKHIGEMAARQPLSAWKTYLRWNLLSSSAHMLSAAFVDEHFNFYGRILSGQREIQPRWKRCTRLADDDLGEALGRKYVELTFGADGKARTLSMIKNIENAFGEDLKTVDWMSPATKDAAVKKLAAIENKIGYPDKWKDYSKVKITRDDAFGNDQRASAFEFRRDINKIGRPLDRTQWDMTPPTVNAYYDPSMNNINFPAGILQPPFFDRARDEAGNYGAIGAIIGHEMTHGFDDEGRHYDGAGNMVDWWNDADAKAFEKRAQCLVDEYSTFVATADLKLNGKLTLGENTADNGGLRMSFMAYEAQNAGKPQTLIDGFTPEQRFFLGWGQVYCENITPEMARYLALNDPHSPGRARVNYVLQNMEGFAKAFSCKQGQPMVPANPCRIW